MSKRKYHDFVETHIIDLIGNDKYESEILECLHDMKESGKLTEQFNKQIIDHILSKNIHIEHISNIIDIDKYEIKFDKFCKLIEMRYSFDFISKFSNIQYDDNCALEDLVVPFCNVLLNDSNVDFLISLIDKFKEMKKNIHSIFCIIDNKKITANNFNKLIKRICQLDKFPELNLNTTNAIDMKCVDDSTIVLFIENNKGFRNECLNNMYKIFKSSRSRIVVDKLYEYINNNSYNILRSIYYDVGNLSESLAQPFKNYISSNDENDNINIFECIVDKTKEISNITLAIRNVQIKKFSELSPIIADYIKFLNDSNIGELFDAIFSRTDTLLDNIITFCFEKNLCSILETLLVKYYFDETKLYHKDSLRKYREMFEEKLILKDHIKYIPITTIVKKMHCSICDTEHEKFYINDPCLHICMCKDCFNKLTSKNCPFCRKPITKHLEVFIC